MKTMWEDGDLEEKINYNNLNGFCGPGWYRSVEKIYKKEGERVIEDALLAVGAGAAESAGLKVNRPGVFMEVLRDMRRSRGVDQRCGDKVDKV